jgi:hypothetical protein
MSFTRVTCFITNLATACDERCDVAGVDHKATMSGDRRRQVPRIAGWPPHVRGHEESSVASIAGTID